jgi:hypothetical protein
VPEYDYDATRRVARGEPETIRRVVRDDADETRRAPSQAGAEDETRRAPARDGEEETQRLPAPDEDSTEPLVRRRRPRPEWLEGRDAADDGEEPLVWPREPPPDR